MIYYYNLSGDFMFTIRNEKNLELVIKNSKFISFLFYVESENDVKEKINYLSSVYKDYTHLVYAYKLCDSQKAIDDGEPSGTAGNPILDVINKNNLINTLIVVIRYFGGIKLGAGGLIRAYSKAARDLIDNDNLEEYIKYNYYELRTSYDNKKLLGNLTIDLNIIKKDFTDDIVYTIKIDENYDNINEIFKDTIIKPKKL